tara:strand:+ start:1639 stop:1797 length:159 start_codon:yes stop_codon:yes gene_type:complete
MKDLVHILKLIQDLEIKPISDEMKIALGKNELPRTFKGAIDKIKTEAKWRRK